MAKSYRTAFIRVTSLNNTNNGIVIYTKDDIFKVIDDWSRTSALEYWFIQHEADEEDSNIHFHIVIRFKNPMPFTNIKAKFPFGNIECARNLKNCVQYLVHMNDKSKKQYAWDDIITNCKDINKYKLASKSKEEEEIIDILFNIEKGIIREYNQFEMIDINVWSKYKGRIENALTYYRERIYMDKNRSINVIMCTGDTGTGKTTFAKRYCEKMHKSYSISSSSNDCMQDYKGEDVLILDDLRDSDFKFTDLLKILDNHTKSTVKSRYHNKAFLGDTIIITSYKPLCDWYYDISSESKHQLYRRIQQQYKFKEDKIECFQYSEKYKRYELIGTAKNDIVPKLSDIRNTVNLFASLGMEFEVVEEKSNIEFNQCSLDEINIFKQKRA